MSAVPPNPEWEQPLKAALGQPSAPDFEAWRERHPGAVAYLNPVVTRIQQQRRTWLMRTLNLTASSLCLATLVWFFGFRGGPDQSAYAETVKGIEEAQTITWTTTFYNRVTSADGKRTWLKTERRLHAYRHPGLYRETGLKEDGSVSWVEINDANLGQQLSLSVRDKKAILKMATGGNRDLKGPFAWVIDGLRMRPESRITAVELVEQKSAANGKINVFRILIKSSERGGGVGSYDVWIDAQSKQLVEVRVPGAEEFDPATAPDRNNPPEEKWSTKTGAGYKNHEIVLNAQLDPELFSLKPPEEYQLETKERPTVTEAEMIEYLGAAARFNDGVFPDSPFGLAVDNKEFNAIWSRDKKDWTDAEKKIVDLHRKYVNADLNKLPVRHFEDDHTVSGSFRYIGARAKLGTADRIICWYRLKESGKLRAVYADLEVKDVAPEDLPLDVK
ncbi:MAG: hypothetical protein SH850_13465 [Planctomycetaceae bacterium]|nr:hypothetical protein [Planctomycetaceae bacterium]